MRGKTRRISGGRLAAAAAVAAHLIYMAAAGPASAMQILEAADHGELGAEISATGVNRIALSHDRIRRVIRAPGGFETEHDPETGDLYLRPTAVGQGAEPDLSESAPVILFIGTEKGFTYRLTLTPSDRDSAQILIRNGAALTRAETGAAVQSAGADPRIGSLPRTRSGVRGRARVAALVALIRAVARREPPAGSAIETGTGRAIGGLPVIETWRGRRLHGACRRKRQRGGQCRGSRRDHGNPGGVAAWLAATRHRALGRPSRGDRDRRRRPGQRDAGQRDPGRRDAGQRNPGEARNERPRLGEDRNERASTATPGRSGAGSWCCFRSIAAVVLVVLAVWLTAGGGGQPAVQGGIEAELAGPDTAEKVWTRRSEARIGTIETRLREMETEARRLGSENERLRQKLAGDAANARSVIDRQATVIDALERQMNAPPPTETPRTARASSARWEPKPGPRPPIPPRRRRRR